MRSINLRKKEKKKKEKQLTCEKAERFLEGS